MILSLRYKYIVLVIVLPIITFITISTTLKDCNGSPPPIIQVVTVVQLLKALRLYM